MTPKKYILYPGYTISEVDGDSHYISAAQLAELYEVNLKDCIISLPDDPSSLAGRDLTTLIPLSPQYKKEKYRKVSDGDKP